MKKKKMRAAYYYGPEDIRVEKPSVPEIRKREMLLKVHAAALCGTDLRIFHNGHFKIRDGEKRALCHEFSGELVKVGTKVKGFSEGMRVSVIP
ncbi:MAG: alcohol dehydrogenase catalytic domain-containing protein, partial [Eubacterium sp.]|nr:alcohol dehydrogenase catalytic domain-containing protein [Eubacterium sp.]